MKYCLAVLIILTLIVPLGFAQDTVHVKTGWNIIGSVKAGPVPNVLSTIPDSIITGSFFGYAPGVGYQSTDTLNKGIGYWVKAKSDGLIVFKTTPAIDSCKSKAFIYQGKFYNTVGIGDQCWMAENLDVGAMVTGITNQTDNDTTEKYFFNNDPLNCALYGGLYQWSEAMQYVSMEGAQGICPLGWRVPTMAEYQTLSSVVGGGGNTGGNTLKAVGQGTGGGAGTNTSGFSALLAGARSSSSVFSVLGSLANFWTSTEYTATTAANLTMADGHSYVSLHVNTKDYGFSVRCLAD
jgi:uncharacterized protein (TIGR02145 family)